MSRSLARLAWIVLWLAAYTGNGCAPRHEAAHEPEPPALVGAWRSAIQFESGAFASIHDLEFLYVFNQGGTMTESSNYDGAPPVPPAYGVWRQLEPHVFETRYEFFVTRPPERPSELSGGWLPAGRGVFTERITLADDGRSYTSTIVYEALDSAGNTVPGGGTASGKGMRIAFGDEASEGTVSAPGDSSS
jgi:hypothetical protein